MTSLEAPGVAAYLRPAFELAYRLTGDLDRAALIAEDGLVQSWAEPGGAETIDRVFRTVIRASGGSVPPARVCGPWNLERPAEELHRDARYAIAALPLDARAVLVLREAFELPRDRIGAILEVSVDEVWELLDRARVGLARPVGRVLELPTDYDPSNLILKKHKC